MCFVMLLFICFTYLLLYYELSFPDCIRDIERVINVVFVLCCFLIRPETATYTSPHTMLFFDSVSWARLWCVRLISCCRVMVISLCVVCCCAFLGWVCGCNVDDYWVLSVASLVSFLVVLAFVLFVFFFIIYDSVTIFTYSSSLPVASSFLFF